MSVIRSASKKPWETESMLPEIPRRCSLVHKATSAEVRSCSKVQSQVRKLKSRLSRPNSATTESRIRAEVAHLEAQISTFNTDLKQIQHRIDNRKDHGSKDGPTLLEDSANRRLPGENQREFLIRTGKITPFAQIPGRSLTRADSTLQEALLDAEDGDSEHDKVFPEQRTEGPVSHRNLLQPGFKDANITTIVSAVDDTSERSIKRRRLRGVKVSRSLPGDKETASPTSALPIKVQATTSSNDEDSAFEPNLDDSEIAALGQSYDEDEGSVDDQDLVLDTRPLKGRSRRRKGAPTSVREKTEDLTGLDDGNETLYQQRLQSWIERRRAARLQATTSKPLPYVVIPDDLMNDKETIGGIQHEEVNEEEWVMPHPRQPDTEFEGGYRIPGDIYPSLFDYQKTGVKWLWELYAQQVGGIIGDEMGLGKTIQVIAFLAGLHHSNKINRPVIIVTPATVMKQWVNEFHTWWPPFRVSILHTSGSGMIDIGREARHEEELLSQLPTYAQRKSVTKAQKAARRIVDRVVQDGHVLVTTYSGLQTYAELLIPVGWEYAILDEGHKIRNPNTAITIYCKELRTANRIILSGTPMQNNLMELWSLFDFIFPMRLGTLVNFRQQFEIPIRQGGYANASNLQVQTAMRCAETLKDTISPYLLQRFKLDVASDLPNKSEQVLFCKLTKLQREEYERFLDSDEMRGILSGKRQVLFGVDILRKICNHPDLQEHKTLSMKPGYNYGSGTKSGKMQVVKELIELWKNTGHKTLLFAQHRIMLDILEKFIRSLGGFNYLRMDGNTPISTRQELVDKFNQNADIHLFLLTTKVGGLGVNLTGADRVIIYDPDWNPSTDIQARERAWRLGQKREVKIYRLMTAGTIEEKIYHRQLFKQFLTNRILRDPKQRQTFQLKDLHDLFTLGGAEESVETSEIFPGTEAHFRNGGERSTKSIINGYSEADDDTAMTGTSGQENASSVRSIVGVASLEPFRGAEEEPRKPNASEATNSEARVMETIFARSGVHSALEHDQIINGKRVIAADPKIIEREAKRVAAEAARELKKAGEVAKTVPVGTPTWTGEYGIAGRPDLQFSQRGFGRGVGRGGPASSSILAGLENRQTGAASGHSTMGTSSGRGFRQGTPNAASGGKDFMTMIRDYLATHGGSVHTQMLIDHFNLYCDSPAKTAEFKEMLKLIARLEKGRGGRGRWILRDEFN